ncbi:FCD domain-containing protein [Shinella sp. AETb1-6]|jgi:DNA-binding FadR family transcriptional regulator|uniref:FCD domain-containing protein n=1 Tax=Shinella sumterensis TaxID=1967501 RepID=A0AA50H8M2_9HYPH|nr:MULTISPECIES: FCD domain-containing protein [Shinella]MCD1266769.1 FCD domain-containing protein [Shinella sumterensis]MXN54070.1 FCD domain-containing protein [Shinella sp. AETb1-6]TFE95326.1 GntR family transcriptional regulator [Shinella sumterensis]WLR99317.1 FCD domain-containing protein [Shinella sumterensis]
MIENTDAAVLSRLRDFLATAQLPDGGRLPPERDLAESLDVGRSALRKALATLQAEGVVWRHVGKGTFTGERPIDTVADINAMVHRTNPLEVMGARIAFEPEVARCAALNATPSQIAELRSAMLKAQQAPTWRLYEQWDNRLHRLIGEASQNSLLLGLLDTLNAVRRAVTWGRLRDTPVRPPPDHHSFEEHARIVDAIANRDGSAAADAMRRHLRSVEGHMRDVR